MGEFIKEHPILFSSPMVKAIIEGRKTQTRRVVKPVHGFERHNICKPDMAADPWAVWWHGDVTDRVGCLQNCPYGVPGGRLWVREKHLAFIQKVYHTGGTDSNQRVIYAADGGSLFNGAKWKPSTHMPRWASRITLELTGVRVECVQDISEADATAEGTQEPSLSDLGGMLKQAAWSERQVYQRLWDHINGKREGCAWKDNPWVWVLEFRRIPQK